MRKTVEVEIDVSTTDVLDGLAQDIYQTAEKNGFWEDGDDLRTVPVKLALITSEVSEALEAHRKKYDCPEDGCVGDYYCEYQFELMTPEQHADFGEELADIIIRTLDLAYGLNVSIGQVVQDKVEKNRDRPFKHNKKY